MAKTVSIFVLEFSFTTIDLSREISTPIFSSFKLSVFAFLPVATKSSSEDKILPSSNSISNFEFLETFFIFVFG